MDYLLTIFSTVYKNQMFDAKASGPEDFEFMRFDCTCTLVGINLFLMMIQVGLLSKTDKSN